MRPAAFRLSTTLLVLGLAVASAGVAAAQTVPAGEAPAAPPVVPTAPAPAGQPPGLHVDFTVMNAFDGNINRESVPLRSYGLAPGVSLHYEPAGSFAWGYDGAVNQYTGTDRWDRISHALSGVMARRFGAVDTETRATGSWKVPTDDREITKQVEVVERLTASLSNRTLLQLVGAYRYKYYVDHVDTSGNSPYMGARLERRYGAQHLTFAYRYQVRQSRARAERYSRQGYAAAFSTPVTRRDDLSIECEYRPQLYRGLIQTPDGLARRRDRRILTSVIYQRPVTTRVSLLALAGFQRRWSNDLSRRFAEPSVALSLRYRWR